VKNAKILKLTTTTAKLYVVETSYIKAHESPQTLHVVKTSPKFTAS
jgi:hypothetical protein